LARVPGVTFTANSQATAAAYEDWLGLPRGFVGVIPNAVPIPTNEGAPEDQLIWDAVLAASPDCTRTVLGVFRFDHNKRPEDWVRLAADHAGVRPGVRFVILGTGVEHAQCQRLVTDLGMEGRIFLPGATRHVGFFLHRCDLVMHLARHEGLPNALIEAQLAGKPVLATPAGGTAEVVRHGETGILLSDNIVLDRDEVFRSLDHLLQDPDQLARMGLAARRHSGDRFQIDRISRRASSDSTLRRPCCNQVSGSSAMMA
jgi:glycosyltransferase involved in cell wall biosynthesis